MQDKAERGVPDWLIVIGIVAALASAILAVWIAYLSPRLVVEWKTITGNAGLEKRLAPAVPQAEEEIVSPAFFDSIREACKKDRELVRTWTPATARFALQVQPNGCVLFSYSVPAYSVRYFSFRDFSMGHDPVYAKAAYPQFSKDMHQRNLRANRKLEHLVRGILETLVRQEQAPKGGPK